MPSKTQSITRIDLNTLAELDIGERLFVWGLRSVVQCRKLDWQRESELQRIYNHFGVGTAVASLDAIVEALAYTAHTSVELHGSNCPCVSASELLLLQAVGSAQQGLQELARRQFQRWLPSSAADWVLGPVCGLARTFKLGGLSLPVRHGEAISHEREMATRNWSIAPSKLH